MPDTSATSPAAWMEGGPKEPDTSWLNKPTTASKDTGSVVAVGGAVQSDNQKDFDFTVKYNQNNQLLRAQNQSAGKQALLTLGNGLSNIVTGLAEGVGYLGAFATEWGDDRDYSNALTQQMQKWHNPLGEVYREHPDKTFDVSDPAWWFENVQQLVESAGSFALEGIGLAKVFGGAASAAGKALQLGKLGLKVGQGAAEVASAATLAYTEGAMSGYRIYDEVYNNHYQRSIDAGVDPVVAHEEARHIASEAAATTVKTNTLINTVFNIGELSPLFKAPENEAVQLFKSKLKQQEGESLRAYGKRLATATVEEFPELKTRHGWTSRGAEMLKEGVEEINTQYAEEKGKRVGKGQVVDSIGDITNYIKDVSNGEGALQFLMGALGGGIQTALIDHIPARYTTFDANNQQHVLTDKSGDIVYDEKTGAPKYQKFLVSPRSYDERGKKKYFEDLKDSVQEDITHVQNIQDKLMAATAANNTAEVEQLKGQLFSVGALNAVTHGQGLNWIEQYKQIHDTDNTKDLGEALQPKVDQSAQALQEATANQDPNLEAIKKEHAELLTQQVKLSNTTAAMQAGLAQSKTDNEYKDTARQAQEDLKHLTDLHEHIQKKYNYEGNPASGELTDHLFYRTADFYLRKRAIDKVAARLAKEDSLEDSTQLDAGIFQREMDKYNQHIGIWNGVLDDLNTDIKSLQKGNPAVVKDLIGKYRAKDGDEGLEDLVGKINAKQRMYQSSIKAAREALTGFKEWETLNPDGTVQKFADEKGAKIHENVLRQYAHANLESIRAQHDIASQNLNELTTKKGLDQVYKSLAEDKKSTIDEINKRNRTDNTAAFLAAQEKAAVARMSVQQRQVQINKIEEQLNSLKDQWNKNEAQRVALQLELKDAGFNKSIKLRTQLGLVMAKQAYLKNRMDAAKAKLATLNTQLTAAQNNQNAVETANETVPQSEQQVVDAIDDPETNIEKENFQHDPASDNQESFYNADELTNMQAPAEVSDATGRFLQIKSELPVEGQRVLDRIEKDHKPGTRFSYDALKSAMRSLLSRGEVKQSTVNEIMVTMPKYLDQKDAPVAGAVLETVSTPDAPPSDVVIEDATPEIIENAVKLTNNDNLFTDEELSNAYWAQSPKTTNAVKGNSSDLKYTEILKDGKTVMRNVTVDGVPQLDDKTNKATMIPGYLNPGQDVYLEIDTAWDGRVVSDTFDAYNDEDAQGSEDSFDSYTEGGKIRMEDFQSHIGYGNMPIKIVDAKTGETLKYFPRVSWITMTKGLANFRNVEDLLPPDADGNRKPGNVRQQMDVNLAIRRRLAEMYNEDPSNARLKTTITDITGGIVMYHGDMNPNTGKVTYKPKLAKNLLPDTSLVYAVANRSGIMVGKNQQAADLKNLTNRELERLRGTEKNPRATAIVLIPLANGKKSPEPLTTVPLVSRKGEINTIVRALELYLAHDGSGKEVVHPLIQKIQAATGFDISTSLGLKHFIEQYYTYTSGFKDSRLLSDAPIDGKKVQQFLFQIPENASTTNWNGKADIKVGTVFSGKAPLRPKLVDGKLDLRFREALEAGLATRFKTITFSDGPMTGLNDPRPFKSISIDKNDRLSVHDHANYNEFMKSFVSTVVEGTVTVKDPRTGKDHHVYAANGQTMLDAADLIPSAVQSIRDIATDRVENVGTTTEADETADDIWDEIENGSRSTDYVTHTIQADGPQVTVENLQQLLNFTPKLERNGQSVEDVLARLSSLGISKIAEGYNPFQKC